jgi:hypothetical protein
MTSGLTPEQVAWLAEHERLHNEYLKRQQQVELATRYITNEDIRNEESKND